ncbi:docking protein 3 [Chanos chanos]|uniref:Docking protein 3 n=1 Tax=Chanos chanos TaxID=29144 RepID=A0A6J2UQ36_CHACN|nr:docking protein 3 [Chanos chanos]
MDVVKEGLLFLQCVKFGKRIWRKAWMILFESSSAGIGRIELYDVRGGGPTLKSIGLKRAERRVIRLSDCLSITPAPEENCPSDCSGFYLNTSERTLTFAAPASEDWVSILCQVTFQRSNENPDTRRCLTDNDQPMADNELYSSWGSGQHRVIVQQTEASVKCGMSGSFLLSPEKEALCLLDLKTGQAMYRWPYRFLRRFGQIKEGITIEAGRRCQTGEGQFVFLSKNGPQIYRAIEEAIMHQSVQELLANTAPLPNHSSAPQAAPKAPADVGQQQLPIPPARKPERPCPAIPRRNVSLPDPPVKIPLTEPDTLLYATIKPTPKKREKATSPKNPNSQQTLSPPVLYKGEEKQESLKMIAEVDEDMDSSDYTNLGPDFKPRQDSPSSESVYSFVMTPSRPERTQLEKAKENNVQTDQFSSIFTSVVPVNFKQKLAEVLSKELEKIPPPLPPRPDGLLDDLEYSQIQK